MARTGEIRAWLFYPRESPPPDPSSDGLGEDSETVRDALTLIHVWYTAAFLRACEYSCTLYYGP